MALLRIPVDEADARGSGGKDAVPERGEARGSKGPLGCDGVGSGPCDMLSISLIGAEGARAKAADHDAVASESRGRCAETGSVWALSSRTRRVAARSARTVISTIPPRLLLPFDMLAHCELRECRGRGPPLRRTVRIRYLWLRLGRALP